MRANLAWPSQVIMKKFTQHGVTLVTMPTHGYLLVAVGGRAYSGITVKPPVSQGAGRIMQVITIKINPDTEVKATLFSDDDLPDGYTLDDICPLS
jgi:hypothetical protein